MVGFESSGGKRHYPGIPGRLPEPAARSADVAWLTGYWVGDGLGGTIEEVDDTLQFVVKHFNPDWVGWEEKDKALRIRLSRIAADEIVFGRIVFQRTAPDGLVVKLAIRQKSGELRHETLTYRRKAL